MFEDGRLGTKVYDEGKQGGDCQQGMVNKGRAAKTKSRGMRGNLILLSGSKGRPKAKSGLINLQGRQKTKSKMMVVET